ncbi:hypothetical protein VN24_06795 [Paenibacillus beijingensis]|uniref:NodB homology domain-containing protein n=2 Tax=Paenibacillus beijingensis TaxID=1126833 RepID=A0A0D5NQT2_9BACL|nr:hypothetical protein VN24_06795 [Paenibacillus beijingensis]
MKGEKVVALTFDDGPDGRYTPEILDILKRYKVKASFFVVGTQAKKFPDVLKRIADEGHLIGNHTYHHIDLAKASKAKILQEIAYNDILIQRAVGFTPTFVRPPYGALSSEVRAELKSSGRELALWNVDTRDWAGTSVTVMRNNVNCKVKPGSVILMHSFGSGKIRHTVELLPLLIQDLRKQGYTFVTYDQLP